MQCEGITRAGERCRNKALDDEIFCEVHLRVNRTYNLALLVPFLTTLLLCYFFLFGLFFETLHYGIFDLHYLKYAGLSDFFISMLRNGGVLTIVVLKAWIFYTAILAVIFGLWLIVKVVMVTSHKHLKPVRRMKIMGLSLGIFILNVLHMFVVLLPKRNRKNPSQILIGREHLALSLHRHRRALGEGSGPDPADIARDIYRRFLAVCTFNNHRFFVTILVLVVASTGSILYAGYDARKMRECIIMVADRKILPAAADPSATLYPALNMSNLCQSDLADLPDDVDVSSKFRRSLTSFFRFPVVNLKQGEAAAPVLYLGSTARFELFFNGSTRLPFAVPVQNLGPLFDQGNDEEDSRFAAIEGKIDSIEKLARENNETIATLGKSMQQREETDTANLKLKLEALERSAAKSEAALDNLEEGLGRVSYALNEVELDHTKRIVATIPDYCWDLSPHMVVTFKTGSTRVTGADTQDLIRQLATRYAGGGSRFIVISGHSDPSGSSFDNYRLSRQRAAAVTNLMLEAGLEKTALYMIGRGEDNSSSLPQRRVEIRDCTKPD
ncbi:OmpA family protein [Sneathiella chungangensis]|uniref:OmpA family protein n=1 Tax=Sneathiella chungangensis TaxID=1418234 RepID=A0A845MDK8_9PROT|nr:OmpA family protein [Sneathiella chungangensis]MZR21307.1 OmpA family protein [Sneathiella chungangensis]